MKLKRIKNNKGIGLTFIVDKIQRCKDCHYFSTERDNYGYCYRHSRNPVPVEKFGGMDCREFRDKELDV